MTLTITDLFCGGGGSSTGATQVPAARDLMAAVVESLNGVAA